MPKQNAFNLTSRINPQHIVRTGVAVLLACVCNGGCGGELLLSSEEGSDGELMSFAAEGSQESAVATRQFIKGGAMGHVSKKEQAGFVYKENGVAKDPFQSIRDHGSTYAMIEIWDVQGWRGLQDCLALATRAKAAGLNIMLNIFYSDDYEHTIPDAWPTSFNALKNKVYSYTRETLQAFYDNGTPPLIVKVGNEVDLYGGFLLPVGAYDSDAFYALLKTGCQAVKDFDSKIKTVLHTYSASGNNHMMSRAKSKGVPFDIYGISYYPNWGGDLCSLPTRLNSWDDVGKEILLTETANIAWTNTNFDSVANLSPRAAGYGTSPADAGRWLRNMVATLRNHPKAIGVLTWPTDSVTLRSHNQTRWDNVCWWNSSTGKLVSAVANGFSENTTTQVVALHANAAGRYVRSSADGTLVANASSVAGNAEKFRLNCMGGDCSLQSLNSGAYITAGNGSLQARPASVGNAQLWRLEVRADGHMALRSKATGRHMEANRSHGWQIRATWTDRDAGWQSFHLITVPAQTVALRANAAGRYVHANANGTLVANATSVTGNAEKFAVSCTGRNCSLRSLRSGRYLTAGNGQLKATATSVGNAQLWQLEVRADGRTALRSKATGRHMEANKSYGWQIRASWNDRDAGWQSFNMVSVP